jgi:hypothetical protein
MGKILPGVPPILARLDLLVEEKKVGPSSSSQGMGFSSWSYTVKLSHKV